VGLKGQEGVLDDVFVTAALYEERCRIIPLARPDGEACSRLNASRSRPDDGTVVEELDQPRASFAGQTLETPWTTLQLAYFVGTAMWTFLTQPFSFTLGAPGCSRQARHASQETCPRRSRSWCGRPTIRRLRTCSYTRQRG
jgi:hypothetical protein